MEKVLFAADELTGLIWAAALMRPSKSTKDMELKSLKKKYKSKGFAAGCSREVIQRGADQLGWELEKLLTMTWNCHYVIRCSDVKEFQQHYDQNHSWDKKCVSTEANQTNNGNQQSKNGGCVIRFFHPLLQKDYNKHGCHDEADSFSIYMKKRSGKGSKCCGTGPVELI